jgi:glycosyltransferase involved in cell wall biosynthesis
MRIAQVAPLTEAVPPTLYGGTERVISWLTEELVALGNDVTLFASGDSVTSAKLEAMWPRALRLDGTVRDPNALNMTTIEKVYRRSYEFDLIHFHLDYYPFSLMSRQATPFLTTLHGRLDLPEHHPTFEVFSNIPIVSISNSQRRPIPKANWMATVHHGLPADLRHPHRPAVRPAAQNRRQGRSRRPGLFRRNDQAAAVHARCRIHRRDWR